MTRNLPLVAVLCAVSIVCPAASKEHIIAFGKSIAATWPNATGAKMIGLRVRPLLVDARVKEYTTGVPHEITDRLFTVRRVFRVNDALPDEKPSAPRWQWQRGGWLLVDRLTGRVSQLSLPEFDPYYSSAAWYRDYIAYCGVADDGGKLYAVVAQVGRRKPILKKLAGEPLGGEDPDTECSPPSWERSPMRVTFQVHSNPGSSEKQKLVFSLRNHVVDVVSDVEEAEE